MLEQLSDYDIPYVHLDISIRPFVAALTKYLQAREASDAILIFQNDRGEVIEITVV